MKTLLIVYHTGGVKTATMATAVERGARGEAGVNVVMKRCADAAAGIAGIQAPPHLQ